MSLLHFHDIIRDVQLHGKTVISRGLETREIMGYEYVLPPLTRFMCFDERKLKMDYIKQEFMWYLVGEPTDHSICRVASMWEGLVNDDKTINSNYGYHIFNPKGGLNGKSNFDRVVETLKADPQSRRAVMMILNTNHLNSETKDYPCTVYLNFLIRDNKLNMFVRMRSQDAIYGMGNDAPFFSFVHELVLCSLKSSPQLGELVLGEYTHSADSFHIYKRHYEMMHAISNSPNNVTVDYHKTCPLMNRFTPIYMKKFREELLHEEPYFDGVRADPFINWLLTRDDENTILLPDIR